MAPGEPLDPAAIPWGLADERPEVWLEIGFGGGEHLAAQAERHVDVAFLGCELFLGGIASLLRHIRDRGLDNVRIVADDAGALMAALGEASISRLFLLFPDPWPKTRHHKRRLVNAETLDHLARILRDGATVRFATDDRGYCAWTLGRFLAHAAFDWPAEHPGDWRQRPADWPATRYERAAVKAGRRAAYLTFVRHPR